VCAALVLDDEWAVTATTGGARWCSSPARNDILATSMLDCVVDAPAAAGRAAVKSRIVAARRQRASIRRCGVPMRRREGSFVVTQPLQRSSPSEMEAAFATAREPRGVLASTPDGRATLDAMERVCEALAAFDTQEQLFVLELSWMAVASHARAERLSEANGFCGEQTRQLAVLDGMRALVQADTPDAELERLWRARDIEGIIRYCDHGSANAARSSNRLRRVGYLIASLARVRDQSAG
jgi:hypothetical protein